MKKVFEKIEEWCDEYRKLIFKDDDLIESHWFGYAMIFMNIFTGILVVIAILIWSIAQIVLFPINLLYKTVIKSYYIKQEKKQELLLEIKRALEKEININRWINGYILRLNAEPLLYLGKKVEVVKKNVNINYGKTPDHFHYSRFHSRTNTIRQASNSYGNYDVEEIDKSVIIAANKDYKVFIESFLYGYNQLYYTSHDNKSTCYLNRRRSMYDIYRVTKYYFEDVTFNEIVTHLIKLTTRTSNRLCASYCGDVHKYVFYPSSISQWYVTNINIEYADNITFNDLILYFKNVK